VEEDEWARKKRLLIGAGVTALVLGGGAFAVWKMWPLIRGERN
jgi:hypothetical protein